LSNLGRAPPPQLPAFPAFTINLFSALIGSIGVFFFFVSACTLLQAQEGSVPRTTFTAALFAAYAFGFSKSFWSVSLAAKGGIYAFQAALELALLYFFTLRNPPEKSEGLPRSLFVLFFLGLCLANQWPTLLLLLAAFCGATLMQRAVGAKPSSLIPRRNIAIGVALLSITLSIYLYTPLRSAQNPALNFGNPSNWIHFSESLFRTRYFKMETMASSTQDFFPLLVQKSLYISDRFFSEFSLVFSFMALWGIWTLWRRGTRTTLLFFVLLILITITANLLYLRVGPIEFWHLDDHLLTLNWAIGLLGAVGLHSLFGMMPRRKTWTSWALSLGLIPGLLTLIQSFPWTDQKREFLFWGIGTEALRSMDRNPHYFGESDFDYFSLLYLKEVEKKRPDLELNLTSFLTDKDWADVRSEMESVKSNGFRPIYCAFPNGDFVNGYLRRAKQVSFSPNGTIIRLLRKTKATTTDLDQIPLNDLWDHYLAPALTNNVSLNPINGLMAELCAHPYINAANYLKFKGDLRNWDSFYVKSLSLIQDPKWSAETSANKAEGDLLLGDKTVALVDYLFAYQQYKKLGMGIQSEEMWRKALGLQPKTPSRTATK
jgi:hypothetical protein